MPVGTYRVVGQPRRTWRPRETTAATTPAATGWTGHGPTNAADAGTARETVHGCAAGTDVVPVIVGTTPASGPSPRSSRTT